jgi:hypothetical protein
MQDDLDYGEDVNQNHTVADDADDPSGRDIGRPFYLDVTYEDFEERVVRFLEYVKVRPMEDEIEILVKNTLSTQLLWNIFGRTVCSRLRPPIPSFTGPPCALT